MWVVALITPLAFAIGPVLRSLGTGVDLAMYSGESLAVALALFLTSRDKRVG